MGHESLESRLCRGKGAGIGLWPYERSVSQKRMMGRCPKFTYISGGPHFFSLIQQLIFLELDLTPGPCLISLQKEAKAHWLLFRDNGIDLEMRYTKGHKSKAQKACSQSLCGTWEVMAQILHFKNEDSG